MPTTIKRPEDLLPPDGSGGFAPGVLDNLYADTESSTVQADAAVLEKNQPAPTLGEQIKAAWDSESVTAGLIQQFNAPEFKADPTYNPAEKKEWARLTEGIDPKLHNLFLRSLSKGHATYKREQILKEQRNMETLQGGRGTALQVGAAILDPAALAMDSIFGPMAAIGKASRVKRFFSGGLAAGASNAALEGYLAMRQDTRDSSDVLMAGLFGFGIGGPLSALIKPGEAAKLSRLVDEAITRTELHEIKAATDAGVSLTQEGEEVLAGGTRAKVLTVEEMRKRLDEQAAAATDEVNAHINATSEATMGAGKVPDGKQPKPLSPEDRAKLQARVDREDELWNQKKADEEAAMLDAQKPDLTSLTEPAGSKLDGPLQAALKKTGLTAQAKKPDVWDMFEADRLAAREVEENLAFAQREQQIADQPTEGIPGDAEVSPVVEPVKKAEATPAHAAGEDIIVETPDGAIISGRIKSFDPDSGMMVIHDDATDKIRRVNINDVEVADLVESKGFIPGGSVGAANIDEVPIATAYEELAPAASDTALSYLKIPFTNIRIPLRYDYYSLFNNSKNSVLRRLGGAILTDGTGEADHAGRAASADSLASMEWHTQKGRFFNVANEAFDEYAKANNWSKIDRYMKANEFFEAVTRAGRDRSASQHVHPQVGKVVKEIQRIHSELLAKAQKYGVKGAEEVLPDPFYMMRKFNHDRIMQLGKQFGNTELTRLVKGAIRAVRPVTEEMAEKIAKNYITIVRSIPYEDMTRLRLGEAGRARLRAIAEEHGIDSDVMEDVLNAVLEKPGKIEGDSPRLKNRTQFDESFKLELTSKEGKTEMVSLDDFFENDSRVLMDIYTRQMSGNIGLAQVGIRSDADFERVLADARKEAIDSDHADTPRLNKEIKHMRDVYNNILGRPMHDEVYGTQERVLKALRDFNFIRLMGQVGFAQMAELGNTLGHVGFRAASLHMPALRDLIRQAKGGHIDDRLGKDLINFAGLGAEMASMHPMARHAEDMMFNQGLTKVEAAMAKGRHAVAMVSGLAPVTNMLRQASARMFVQKFSDYARKLDKLDKKQLHKLAWSGITQSNIDEVFKDVRKFTSTTGKHGKVDGIDWEKWQATSPETYETFRMAVWKESRRVVQEHTIGETAPWMHTQIGKLLTQFRGFMLVAHSKQTLYSLHHMDLETANAFMYSMVFAGAAYTAQTSLNYAGDKEALNERLSLDNIAKSAFQRSAASSLIPATWDTAMSFAGHEPSFKFGRTTSLATGFFMGIPTVDLLATKLGGTASEFTQMATTDDHMWTKQAAKNAANTILPNLIGVRTLVESWASEFPTNNYLRDYKP